MLLLLLLLLLLLFVQNVRNETSLDSSIMLNFFSGLIQQVDAISWRSQEQLGYQAVPVERGKDLSL